MTKRILVIFVLLFSPFSLVFADTNTQTQNTTQTQTAAATTATQTGLTAPAVPVLLQQIRDAKQTLQAVNLGYTITPHYKNSKNGAATAKTILTGYTLDSKEVAMAVLDPQTQQTAIVKGVQTKKRFIFKDPNFSINQGAFNGINTAFSVSKPAGGVVLALKYLINGPESGGKTAIENALSTMVYVPYSSQLNTYELAQFGQQYLDGVIKEAVFQLSYVQSSSMPGQKLTDAIKPNIIKALVYAEHMDTAQFVNTDDTQSLINRLSVLFAINEGDTFKYSISSGKARGISQFVPSTYMALVNRHPNANLIGDAVVGLSDHVNSIKAEYLLIDDYIAAVRAKITDDFNPAYTYDYGAASYNGGVTRVAHAVKTYGQTWYTDHAAQISELQQQINGESATIKTLKKQIAAANATDKSALKSQLAVENGRLTALQSEISSMRTSALRNETLSYLAKMHRLIQIFNAES